MSEPLDAGGAERRLEEVTRELLELYEEVNVLYTVSEIAARSADLAGAGQRILEEAVSLLRADLGFILYSDADLQREEPDPIGLQREACREIGSLLASRLEGKSSAVVIAPFAEAAAIPGAPEAVVASPLVTEGERLGILCLGRRGKGSSFMAGDQKILSVLAVQAALVIAQRRNLDLSRLARRLEERTAALKGIVEVGREITSTLDLDRVLRAVADLPARVLGFDRCGVLVEQGARFRLRALSGVQRVDRADASVASLEEILIWVAGRGVGFAARLEEDSEGVPGRLESQELGKEAATEGSAAFGERARAHFDLSDCKSLIAIPLADDQGTLGVIGLESSRPDALTEAAREAALILAHQATVAIRNGRLYRDLPFISILEPMQRGRKRLARVPRRRLVAGAAVLIMLVLLSLLIPWDFRIPGTFTLRPGRRIEAVSEVRGVIREVRPVREGDRLEAGEVIASIDDTDWRLRLNEAEWGLQSALREASRLEAEGRAAEMKIRKLEAERWRTERDLLRQKIRKAVIRAPAAGVLLTPRLQERTGELLEVGEILCTLADLRTLRAEIAIGEKDADALGGPLPLPAKLKFQAFPERDVSAEVRAIRPETEWRNDRAALVAEAVVTGPADGLRPGMTGDARVTVGRRSIAALVLRGPYRFVRRMIWW